VSYFTLNRPLNSTKKNSTAAKLGYHILGIDANQSWQETSAFEFKKIA